jgi:hypothetical protein
LDELGYAGNKVNSLWETIRSKPNKDNYIKTLAKLNQQLKINGKRNNREEEKKEAVEPPVRKKPSP